MRAGFVEHTIEGLYSAMERALYAEGLAAGGGLLQRLDPRVKVAGLLALIVAAALAARLWVIAAILAAAVAAGGCFRGFPSPACAAGVAGALIFTGAIAVPAIVPDSGRMRQRSCRAWAGPITAQGLSTAAYLMLRVETAATLALLLVFTTPWAHVLKALRMFRVPVVFVVILGMTCRYILLMLETAHEMFESRKSRTVGACSRATSGAWRWRARACC